MGGGSKIVFSKYMGMFFILLLIFAGVIKIHSILTESKISQWNYHTLQRIREIEKNSKTPGKFSFVVFGDNKNSVKTFDSLISRLNKEDVAFAIDDGDLVYDGEREKFRFFLDQLKGLEKPLFTVLGNHGIREEGRAPYYDIFGPFYYSFTFGNSYFIILDDANERSLGGFQLEWLRRELEKAGRYRYRFVFMHVPLYDPRRGKYGVGHSLKDLNYARRLNRILDSGNVTMLFCSHIHGYYRGVWGKTPYIITGGAGAELAGADPQHYFYHYIKVNVDKSGVKFDIVKLKSPDFELIDRLTHDVWIYIYAFFAIHFVDALLFISLLYLGTYLIWVKRGWILKKLRLDRHE